MLIEIRVRYLWAKNIEERRKSFNGCYENKAEEKIARKRAVRGPGRWLALPLDWVALVELVAGSEAVFDFEIGVEVESSLGEVEDSIAEVVGASKELELGWERDVDSVPTVIVGVTDEVDEFSIDLGMGIDAVAEGNGELNDPDIPVSVKYGENAWQGRL